MATHMSNTGGMISTMRNASPNPLFSEFQNFFGERVRELKGLLLLRSMDDHDGICTQRLIEIERKVSEIEREMAQLKRQIAKEKEVLDKINEFKVIAQKQREYIQLIEQGLPTRLPGQQAAEMSLAAAAAARFSDAPAPTMPSFTSMNMNIPNPSSARATQSTLMPPPSAIPSFHSLTSSATASAPVPITTAAQATAPPSSSASASNKDLVYIQYITNAELATVPSYVARRMTIDKVNATVDSLNKIVAAKYHLLAQNPQRLNEAQSRLYAQYKQQKNKETEGKYFFTDIDLKTDSTIKMDMTGKAVIGVLRHLKRLKETKDGKTTIFICLGVENKDNL